MIPTVKDIANLPVDKLPPLVHVPPVMRPFDVTIRPPGSKSLTNRALLLAALAVGESVLTGALAEADDAQVMVRALRQLGAEIEVTPEFEPNGESCGNATIRVKGVGGRWKIKAGETVTLNLNNAGTATRFLTAAAVLQPPDSGGIVIDGNARMRERPIGELVDKLRQSGASIAYQGRPGHVPLHICAGSVFETGSFVTNTLADGGPLRSSQTLSAVLLIAPWLPGAFQITVPGGQRVTSESYLLMTAGLLRRLGVDVAHAYDGADYHLVRGGTGVHPFRYAVEPDASGASYFLVAAAVVWGSVVTIAGLPPGGLQGDACFYQVVEGFGGRARTHRPDATIMTRLVRESEGQTSELCEMPDTAMSAAVLASFAAGNSSLRGLRTLRVKETDRIAALVTELAKVGVTVEPFAYSDANGHPDEGIRITPPPGGIDCSPHAPRVEFDTYDDHRMAMSLALIGLRRPNVYIRDPGCVRKTYPTFWRDLAKLYG